MRQLNPSTMRQMRMLRDTLLEALRLNLNSHRETFIDAQEGYRTQVIKELDTMLEDARSGKKIRRSIRLPEPEDHSDDYESTILMLEMCVDEELEISHEDFQRFVMDNWGWKANWTATTSNYTNG